MFANVDEETLVIVNIFDCRPTEKEYTGALVELDEDMDYQCIEAFRDDADVIRLRTKSDAALIAKVRESDLAFIRTVRDDALRQSDWTRMDDNGLDAATKEAWRVYRQALRDLPQTTSNYKRVTWPSPPDAEFPELKTRLQTIETQANSAIQILSDFGISGGLMDPIDTSTWPTTKSATLAVLDARLRPIETGATGARAILDLFGVDDLPEFTVDETSTIESRLTALETAGASAQQTLQAFGIDI